MNLSVLTEVKQKCVSCIKRGMVIMQRIMCVDLGEKRIGIAVSDMLGITAQGVAHLVRMDSLRDLKFGYMPVDDDCMVEIGKMKSLRTIDLIGLDITDKGLEHLKELKDLSTVRIEDCKKVSSTAMKEFTR